MSEKRWWCDWYLSRSEEPYLRDDERFFIRLVLLIPSIGLLSSWPWWNNQSLFPWWYCIFWSSILIVVCLCLSLCYFQLPVIVSLIFIVCPCAWLWHGFLLLHDIFGVDAKSKCDLENIDDDLQYLFCIWPSGALWWALLRDGFCLILVICLTLSFHFRAKPPRFISASFNGQPLNFPFILNARRDRMRLERRRQRRSSFVIHYVLLRTGQIRRRRRKFRN